jgi:glucan phosphorylase
MTETPVVAYFSMEIGLESTMPTYAGGLGILAGDTLRSAADLEVPMVAVTLLHLQGYRSGPHISLEGSDVREHIVHRQFRSS